MSIGSVGSTFPWCASITGLVYNLTLDDIEKAIQAHPFPQTPRNSALVPHFVSERQIFLPHLQVSLSLALARFQG